MGKGTTNTAVQVLENIEYEAKTLCKHIQLTKDNTVLFMLGGASDGDGTKTLNALLGNYERAVALMAHTMLDNEEIKDFIFASFKSYLAHSGRNIQTFKIEVPKSANIANIGQHIEELLRRLGKEEKE